MSSQNQQTSADPKRMRTLFLSRLLRAQTPGRSSEIRHRNQLTVKAWEKAVQELGSDLFTKISKLHTPRPGAPLQATFILLSECEPKSKVFCQIWS